MSRHDVKPEAGGSTTTGVARSAATAAPEAVQPQVASPQAQLLRLQRRCGNRVVSRLVEHGAAQEGQAQAMEQVERSIERLRGGGHSLDGATLSRMNTAFGADFSGVRVHTGSEAHELNRSVEAKAFATGRDIFFSQGAYSPGSSEGRGLLAHELTHVVQQNGSGLQMKLSVSQADDPQEIEAEQMAQAVMQQESSAPAAQAVSITEGCGAAVNRSVIQRDLASPNSADDKSGLPTPVAQPAAVPDAATPGAAAVDQVNLDWWVDWEYKEAGNAVASTSNARTGKDAAYGSLKVVPDFMKGVKSKVVSLDWVNASPSGGKVPVGSMSQPKGKGGEVSSNIAWGKPPSAAAVVKVDALGSGLKHPDKSQLTARQDAASHAASHALQASLDREGTLADLQASAASAASAAVKAGDDGTTYTVSVEVKADPKATYSRAVKAQHYAAPSDDERRTVVIAVPTEVQKLLGTGSVELDKWLRQTDSSQSGAKDADAADKIDATKTTQVREITKSFEAIFNKVWAQWKSDRTMKSLGGSAQGGGALGGGAGVGGTLGGLTIDFGSVLALAFAENPLLALAVKKAVGTSTVDGTGHVDLQAGLQLGGGIGAGWSDDDLQQELNKTDIHVNQKVVDYFKSEVETVVFNRTTKSHEEAHASQTGRDQQTLTKTASSSATVGVKYVIGEPEIRVFNG